jgi:hypothetical protein
VVLANVRAAGRGGGCVAADLSFVRCVGDAVLGCVGGELRALRSLNLSGCRGVTDGGMALLLQGLRDSGAQLRALSVANCVQLTDKVLGTIKKTVGRDLDDLCIYGCLNLSDTGLVQICNAARGLTRFNHCGCYKVTEHGRRYMFSANPSLLLYNNPREFDSAHHENDRPLAF